jgi:hypothetical protein
MTDSKTWRGTLRDSLLSELDSLARPRAVDGSSLRTFFSLIGGLARFSDAYT